MFQNYKKYLIVMIFLTVIYSPSSYSQRFTKAIEDNSFFIEEAFNQEDGVVQHISNGYYQTHIKDFLYTFTQEWPIGGQTHQLSFTLAYRSVHDGFTGFDDMFFNYRYQLSDGNAWCWIAPRLSLIVPTGRKFDGIGHGVIGFQANLPVSKRLTDLLIIHVNVGTTVLPDVEATTSAGTSVHHTLTSIFAGTSGIWLFHKNFNFMCEVLYSFNADFDDNGSVTHSTEIIISPGLRCAINLGRLQIVPAIAAPLSVTSSRSDKNIFGYLSFEHPI